MNLTEELVVERALKALGLSSDKIRATASQVALSRQVVPYINPSMTADAWRIDLSNVMLVGSDGDREIPNPHITSLCVWIASRTGQVMKVASPDVESLLYWSVQAQEEKVRTDTAVFSKLPDEPPEITLMEVLQKTDRASYNATQIVAYYVIEKRTEPKVEEAAVWAVFLYGVPARMPILLPDVSESDLVTSTCGIEYGAFRAHSLEDSP